MDNCAGAVENRAGLNLKRRRKEEIMSNRLFQGVIHQMRDSIDRTIGVIDESSVIIACSELGNGIRNGGRHCISGCICFRQLHI